MVRLILLAAFVGVIALAVIWMLGTLRTLAPQLGGKENAMLPAKFQRVTYVLLVVLMFGVASGWLGGT